MKSIAKIEVPATALILDSSMGSRDVGSHASTMELYLSDDRTRGMIEWDIPALERTEHIGLWFERLTNGDMALEDYDGVFSLPSQAIAFLKDQKFIVTEDFA